MKISHFVLLGAVVAIVSIAVFTSCESQLDGVCTLTTFEANPVFPRQGGEKVLYSKKKADWWHFEDLTVDGQKIPWDDPSLKTTPASPDQTGKIVRIEGDGFILEQVDIQHISVHLDETDKPREISFILFQGNCWQTIYINQKFE